MGAKQVRDEWGGWLRILIVAALLAGAGLFLRSRGQAENLPPRGPLASFPLQLGPWRGREVVIPQYALDVLGAGEFVERNFTRDSNEPFVDLFIAYFPSQRMGSTIHSPQNCLPGSGWTPVESTRLTLPLPPGPNGARPGGNIVVNRYMLSKGLDKMLVLYWYQAHGRVIASEYWAKFFLVADAIAMNRSDGALVRVMTPVGQNASAESAQERGIAFLRAAIPVLDRYIPR